MNRRIRMWKAFCRIVVLAFLSSGYAAQATTFDVAADFSATNNPNGVWSYGWSSTLTSAFNLYLNHGKFDPIIPVDVWAGSNFPYSPNVSHNGTGSPIHHPTIIWQPGQFSLHPGDNGEYSHARWTAPDAGIFDIAATFTGIDFGSGIHLGTTTDVHVLHNGISLFDGEVNGFGNTSSFSTTVSVGMGDIIDFAVGYGSNQTHTCDTTALSVTIIPEPAAVEMEWVYINDPGVSGHEPFNGEMSKHETTNAQYCEFLNAALASGDITVSNNRVYGANGSNSGADFVGQIYFDTSNYTSYSQITWNGTNFSVRSRDGYDMSNHPVVEVSWYGATAFCNYYGYRLPTEWEWQAVADYDGSYIYGCGTTINQSKANYNDNGFANPLGLSSYPYTSPVNHYASYGYGMNDMAGNAWEWTSSCYYTDCSGGYRVPRGGGWDDYANYCTVSHRYSSSLHRPFTTHYITGFRVARNAEPAEPDIAVSPLSHDFGDVELGTSTTLVVTISNVGTGDLTVSGIALETDFAITSAPSAAIAVQPNETADVEITYTPTVLGHNSAVLKITSDDPDEPVVEVQLSAAGVEIPPPPSEQIVNILTFFDTSVAGGTLLGDGPGNSAEKRLNALRNMLKAAGDLIEDDFFEEACRQLADAYRRMDGQPQPPDFVKGEAVPELAGMLGELMTTLGCE